MIAQMAMLRIMAITVEMMISLFFRAGEFVMVEISLWKKISISSE